MGEDTNNLSWLLLRVSLRAKKGLIKLAEAYELTTMQAFALCLLNPERQLPMHSLSEMLVCDASNVTGIVDKLLGSGYIERKESDTDRRVNTISLTKKGTQLRGEFLKKITEDYLPTIATLSHKEKEIFTNLLIKILAETSR